VQGQAQQRTVRDGLCLLLIVAAIQALTLPLAGCYSENEIRSCVTPIDVGITQPNAGTEYLQGDTLQVDANVRSICGSDYLNNAIYVLASSIDGELGGQWSIDNGAYVFVTEQVLTAGAHTLTLSVASENSASGEDSIDIVVADNAPPSVAILSPAPGNNEFELAEGATITATVADPREPLDSLLLHWTLNGIAWDGAPGNADAEGHVAFVLSGAETGCHELRVTVTDSLDQQDSDSAEFVLWTEPADLSPFQWWTDQDGDTYGSSIGSITSCSSPDGEWINSTDEDCDDSDAEVHPGHADYCGDGIDSDCSAVTPIGCFPSGDISALISDAAISGAYDLVAGVGDIDGDGWNDLALGGDGAHMQIIHGPTLGGLSTDLSLRSANQPNNTDNPRGSLGETIDGRHDLNGDGLADLVLGNPSWGVKENNWCTNSSGVFHLQLGSTDLASGDLSVETGVVLADAAAGSTVSMTGPYQIGTCTHEDTHLGKAVKWLPDADGDGLPDFAVSANEDLGNQEGSVYVYLSSDLASTTSGDIADSGYRVRLDGSATAPRLGASLGTADIDGDGLSDLLISSLPDDPTAAGAVYVVFGRDLPAAQTEIPILGLASLTFTGASSGARAGTWLEGVGDLDGDGDEEFLISAPGERGGDGVVYLVPGFYEVNSIYSLEDPLSPLTSPNATGIVRFVGATGDGLRMARAAGDINGDSYGDFLIGAPGNSTGAAGAGAAYLLYGGPHFWGSWWDSSGEPRTEVLLDDAAAAGVTTARIYSSTENENFGYTLDSLGDVSGDAFADIVVGASPSGGTVRVFFGGGT